MARQVSGSAQDMYGKARDAVSDMSDTARDTASSFEKLLRRTIETSAVHCSLCRARNGMAIGPDAPPLVAGRWCDNCWETDMDTTTLLIIIILVLLVGGGGWYGRGRWF